MYIQEYIAKIYEEPVHEMANQRTDAVNSETCEKLREEGKRETYDR